MVSPWLAAVAAGLAWGLAPPTALGAPFALAGAVAASRSVDGGPGDAPRGALVGGLWFGLQLAWLPGSWDRFAGGGGAIVLVIAVGLLALVPALAWGLAGTARAPGAGLALAFFAVEGLAIWAPLPCGPSLHLAGAAALVWPAAIVGRAGLSGLLLAWGNVAAEKPAWAMATLAPWMLGGVLYTAVTAGGAPLRIGIVQPQTGAFDGRRASTAEARAARLRGLVDRASGADLVVTPEGAWPFDPGTPDSTARAAFAAAWAGAPPTLVGASPADGGNALLAVEDGRVAGRFDKVFLVPVAERVFIGLGKDRYIAGDRRRVVELGGVRLGPLVCYEDLFGSAIRATHAEVIVAASNDAWVPGRGADLHLLAARLAAVEAGRWLVRATASGRSAVIDPLGRVRQATAWIDGDAHPDAPGETLIAEVHRRSAFVPSRVAPFLSMAALALLATMRR